MFISSCIYVFQELCQCRPSDGNCSCCKECMLCLGTLWEECCDCVGECKHFTYSPCNCGIEMDSKLKTWIPWTSLTYCPVHSSLCI